MEITLVENDIEEYGVPSLKRAGMGVLSKLG